MSAHFVLLVERKKHIYQKHIFNLSMSQIRKQSQPSIYPPFFEGGFPGGLQQLVGTLRPSAAHFAHLSTLAAFGEAAARPARGADVTGLRALDSGNMAIFRVSYH